MCLPHRQHRSQNQTEYLGVGTIASYAKVAIQINKIPLSQYLHVSGISFYSSLIPNLYFCFIILWF